MSHTRLSDYLRATDVIKDLVTRGKIDLSKYSDLDKDPKQIGEFQRLSRAKMAERHGGHISKGDLIEILDELNDAIKQQSTASVVQSALQQSQVPAQSDDVKADSKVYAELRTYVLQLHQLVKQYGQEAKIFFDKEKKNEVTLEAIMGIKELPKMAEHFYFQYIRVLEIAKAKTISDPFGKKLVEMHTELKPDLDKFFPPKGGSQRKALTANDAIGLVNRLNQKFQVKDVVSATVQSTIPLAAAVQSIYLTINSYMSDEKLFPNVDLAQQVKAVAFEKSGDPIQQLKKIRMLLADAKHNPNPTASVGEILEGLFEVIDHESKQLPKKLSDAVIEAMRAGAVKATAAKESVEFILATLQGDPIIREMKLDAAASKDTLSWTERLKFIATAMTQEHVKRTTAITACLDHIKQVHPNLMPSGSSARMKHTGR